MTTKPADRLPLDWKAVLWIPPWLVGQVIIGWLGRYGESGNLKVLPEWIRLSSAPGVHFGRTPGTLRPD
ncbi:hypothetical protein [Amycolatopsis pithecellobii]|uniref:Uncharacterized protein n=1 Tax=Amycolatopsis pithecellobii TaxID=664692 RepID=A0A6N7Z753_9PSEU|nr:hypothetical protein [Amycolatopsis pithecellobii]MTD57939.1 hypothetical protein [Amycolatopsis pithecellobii]